MTHKFAHLRVYFIEGVQIPKTYDAILFLFKGILVEIPIKGELEIKICKESV